MLKIEHTEVIGWEAAIRGMRNPLNSWDQSDSYPAVDCGACGRIEREGTCTKEGRDCSGFECYAVGEKDYDLMKRLRNAGTDHRKFMRMLTVYCDITAPLYWWKEYDTYKVGTVANSCSTMHKIHDKEFTLDDFSHEHLISGVSSPDDWWFDKDFNEYWSAKDVLEQTIYVLNFYRNKYIVLKNSPTKNIEEKEKNLKRLWWQMIQLLPTSYNQKRTVMLNYEVLANIYRSRKNHKLDEWRTFCIWIEELPYFELITGKDG